MSKYFSPEAIADLYEEFQSIKMVAKLTGYSDYTINRILITQGIYPCPNAEKVRDLLESDHTPAQISKLLCIANKSIDRYLPYSKGTYKTPEKTVNAIRIRDCRERQKQKENNDEMQ